MMNIKRPVSFNSSFIIPHSSLLLNAPPAGSEGREQLGPRFRRRLGASGGPLLWHSPAARGGKLEAREHSTRRPLSEERRSSRFKLARPYVPRAESARSARAALLQAAAELFNN